MLGETEKVYRQRGRSLYPYNHTETTTSTFTSLLYNSPPPLPLSLRSGHISTLPLHISPFLLLLLYTFHLLPHDALLPTSFQTPLPVLSFLSSSSFSSSSPLHSPSGRRHHGREGGKGRGGGGGESPTLMVPL